MNLVRTSERTGRIHDVVCDDPGHVAWSASVGKKILWQDSPPPQLTNPLPVHPAGESESAADELQKVASSPCFSRATESSAPATRGGRGRSGHRCGSSHGIFFTCQTSRQGSQRNALPRFGHVALFLLLATAHPAVRGADDRETLNKRFDDEIAQFTEQIENSPKGVDLYSRRGDAFFFRGKFAAAVADYEKMVELQPDLERSHWRKGIAYFYAQRYKDAAAQFENYHVYDNVDRENGIWRYLSQIKALGREKARQGLLKYGKDDREPFPDVYRLFSGDLTGEDVLKRINDARITPREREQRLFYTQLYIGLNDYVEGRLDAAEKHLGEAARNNWGSQAGGGPGYMWHVARVHHDLLVAERE